LIFSFDIQGEKNMKTRMKPGLECLEARLALSAVWPPPSNPSGKDFSTIGNGNQVAQQTACYTHNGPYIEEGIHAGIEQGPRISELATSTNYGHTKDS